jgi:hypothetical protein
MAFKEKLLTSQAPIEVAGRRFKRYYVTAESAVFTPDIERAAVDILPKLLPEADSTPSAGFLAEEPDLDGYLADAMEPGLTR